MRRIFDELPTYGGSSTEGRVLRSRAACAGARRDKLQSRYQALPTATTWEEHELDKHYQAIALKQERYCNND